MIALLIIIAIAGACYYVSLRVWPFTSCRSCGGGGRNAGSNARRFGHCKACGGSGRMLRFGNRIMNARH